MFGEKIGELPNIFVTEWCSLGIHLIPRLLFMSKVTKPCDKMRRILTSKVGITRGVGRASVSVAGDAMVFPCELSARFVVREDQTRISTRQHEN